MRLLDLFSGVGGFSLAFEGAGFDTAAFSEVEPFPCRVLAERWPGVPNLRDITKITPEQLYALGEIDVVTFGSPCQDWSVAGKRLGLEGHRSSLFHEAIRVIRHVRPRYSVFENVPGLFSSARGWDFAAVLDELAESGALDIAWGVLDAQWFGVPQRRRRIFVVADFRDTSAGEILSISEGVCRDIAPSRETGEEAARNSGDGVAAAGFCAGNSALAGSVGYEEGMCPTLRSSASGTNMVPSLVAGGQPTRYGKGVNTTADDGAIVFTSRTRDGEKQVEWQKDIAYSLNNPGQGGRTDENCVAFAENQRAEVRTSEVHPQLTAGGGKPGQGYPAVATMDVHPTLARETGGPGSQDYRQHAADNSGMAVRRLTPLECERLQGFPDGWTEILGASDSARYRAMGNAVAVPVVEWIAKRMRKELS